MRGLLSRLDAASKAAYAELTRTIDPLPGYHDAKPVQFVPQSYSGRSILRND